jgi:hypothetical protein
MFRVFKARLIFKKHVYATIDRAIFLVHNQVGRDVILERQQLLGSVLSDRCIFDCMYAFIYPSFSFNKY